MRPSKVAGSAFVASILELQRDAGNSAVAALAERGLLDGVNPLWALQRDGPAAVLDRPATSAADPYPGCHPRILKVTEDAVTVVNGAGAAEVVSLPDFQTAWHPNNPGNPATMQSNAAYEMAYRKILAQAGLPVTGPDVSWEVDKTAPAARTPAQRVSRWIRSHESEIAAAESAYQVDRRAIAGAIAWEALMNVKWSARAYGPGKVHAWTWSGKTVAEEVEAKGDLPKKTRSEREEILATPGGSITYIAAIMNAGAEIAEKHGYNIRRNPPILCFFFNAMDLPKWEAHLAAKKPGDPLEPGPKMGGWVAENMKYLEDTVGKSALMPPAAAAPVQRDKKTDTPPPPVKASLGWDEEGPNKAGSELVNRMMRYAVKGLPAPTGEAIVLVPQTLKKKMDTDPKLAVDVLIHLHGYGIGWHARTAEREKAAERKLPAISFNEVRDKALDRLEEQLSIVSQDRPIIGILPQSQAYHSEFGEEKFDRVDLVTNVFTALRALGVSMPGVGGVILSGHSGAGRTFSKTLGREENDKAKGQRLKELILFDAINGTSELKPVTDWIKTRLKDDFAELSALAAKGKGQQDLLAHLATTPRFRGYATHNSPNKKSPRYVDFFMGTKFKFESVQQAISRWFAKPEVQALGPEIVKRWLANYSVTDVEAKSSVGHEQMMGKGSRFVEALDDWDQMAASQWPRLTKEAQARFPDGPKEYRQMLPDNFRRMGGDPVGWLNGHAAEEEALVKAQFDKLSGAHASVVELNNLRKIRKQTKQIARLEALKKKPTLSNKEQAELNKLKPLEAKLNRLKELEAAKPEAAEKTQSKAMAQHWPALALLQWPQLSDAVRASFKKGFDQYVQVLPLYYKRLNGASPVTWLNGLKFGDTFCGDPLPGLDQRVIDRLKAIEASCQTAVDAVRMAKGFVKFEGAFQPRAVTGDASSLSDHALGLAMHLNYERDPYVRDTAVVNIIERATKAEGMSEFTWKGLAKDGGSREAHIESLFAQYAGASDALAKYFGEIHAMEKHLADAKAGKVKDLKPDSLDAMKKDLEQRKKDLALLKKGGSDFAGRDPGLGFFAHSPGVVAAKDPLLQVVKLLTLKAELQWGGEYVNQKKDLHHYALKNVG